MAKSTTDRLKSLFSTQASITAALRKDLNQIEAEIIAAENRLSRVRLAPVPRAAVEARVDEFLRIEEADARSVFAPAVGALAEGSISHVGVDKMLNRHIVGGLVVLGFRDQLRECLITEVSASLTVSPLTASARRAEIEKLEGEISHLQRVSERIRREAARNGVEIVPPETADPAVLLAPDEEI